MSFGCHDERLNAPNAVGDGTGGNEVVAPKVGRGLSLYEFVLTASPSILGYGSGELGTKPGGFGDEAFAGVICAPAL